MKNKLKKILTLLQGVYSYNILSHFKPLSPTELQINVTYKCNSRCQMCHIWKMKPKNELKFFEWQKIMKDPIFLTTRRLMIAGGEPILHPKLIKLVKLYLDSMSQLQFLSLTTNGFLPQKGKDENPWQQHLSGWSVVEFKKLKYTARGLSGLKFLRKENEDDTMNSSLLSPVKYKPQSFWFFVITLSQLFVYFVPRLAFELFCVKMKKK